jgi:hypothetical protein
MHIYCVYVYIDEDHGTGQGSVLHPALPGSSPDIGEAMVLAVCPTSVQYIYIYILSTKPYVPEVVFVVFVFFSNHVRMMFRKHFAAKQRLKKRRVAVFVADRFRRRSLGLPAREFEEAELAALQPFAGMSSLEDNLEENIMRLVEEEEDAQWLEINCSSYRY